MDKYQIPQHLDEPMKFFLLTADELIVFVLPFLACMLVFDQTILGIILGAAFVFGIKHLKGEQGHYFIYNLMYWHLPTVVRFKITPPSHIREFIG
jgi:conjugal transfer pilus assembly protein TraL